MASRFENSSKEDVQSFLEENENKNTASKTKPDMALVKSFLQTKGETREFEHIPPRELNEIISMFILSIRHKDGTEYEPATLRGMVSSMDRYLTMNYYPTTIQNGEEFVQTRDVLNKKQKYLKKQGKGNKPNAAPSLTDDQIDMLWKNGQLGVSSPDSMLNTLCFFNTASFGLRGCDEHRQMCFGDIQLMTDEEGTDYLEFTERSIKTRQGGDTKNIH